MKVSLKQARRIESAFKNELERLEQEAFSNIYFENVKTRNDAKGLASKAFDNLEVKVLSLTSGINEIRNTIRTVNEGSAINDKIQQISDLERKLSALEMLNTQRCVVSYGDRIGSFNERESFRFIKDYNAQITSLKFKISELKDSTNGQNASLEVELSKATQEVADELGIPV